MKVCKGRNISDSIDVGRVAGFKAAAQSPPSRWDRWECTVSLGRGNYTITVLGGGNCYHGQLQLSLDGSKIGETMDWYCAVTTYPYTHKVVNVSIAQSGTHTLQGEVVGKYKKAQDYWICLTEIQFDRIDGSASNEAPDSYNTPMPPPRPMDIDDTADPTNTPES
eukprot:667615-Prorocentrum_minimum.AAC.7